MAFGQAYFNRKKSLGKAKGKKKQVCYMILKNYKSH